MAGGRSPAIKSSSPGRTTFGSTYPRAGSSNPMTSVTPFITIDYWPEHAEKFVTVWDEVLRSLTLGDSIEDPLKWILH